MTKTDLIYIFLDGDSIGDQVELYLLDENIDKAALLQSTIQTTMRALHDQIAGDQRFELLMYGCDELLFTAQTSSMDTSYVEEMRKVFHDRTGFTMSGGIGTSLRQAIVNLRRAKLSGKDRLIDLD